MEATEKDKKIEELEREIASLKYALVQRTKFTHKRVTIDFGKMLSELNENLGRLIDAVHPYAKEAIDEADKKIIAHPFVCTTMALIAGALIAGRKRK